ncbi:hypothetical protein LSH36_952g00068 [Paralvinella palmiformis]|uniref:Sodium/hydrogen exchanger n=1 Tax=Paralvinella palmiformis TaxID=53620 RepID=A0AAD9MR69_9ANNE|nr:hypothetical protein LSH36_952g00068 [Paralvinella palmiformis]
MASQCFTGHHSFTGIEHRYIVNFSTDLFFLYLLPPIILESAYSLHDRVFFDNLGTILLYAVVGTVMNCFIIAPTLYGLAVCGAMGPISVTLIQCFVFGALIVAVDPVAVLAIFQEIGVNNVLYFLVFGESLLNDAVTVVLYNTMKSFNQMETIPVSQIFLGIGAFFTVSLGGLCIGILTGGFCAFLTKYTSTVRVVEPLAVFSLAYASYLLAELFHFSGIISIIGCGLVQAQYAFHNISHKSHTTVVYFSKMLNTTCDSIIFMFLGLSLVSEKHVWHTGFVLWSILLCLVVRFLIVYFLTFFANKFERLRRIDYEEQFIMAYGGLRGAVAFSLVAMLKESDLPSQPMFETATLAVIIFTVFVQGISIKPLVKCLRITSGTKNPVSIYEEINCHVTDHVLAGIEEICGHYGHNRVREMLDYFDNNHLRPLLMRDPNTKDDDIMELYEKIALQMHFENIAGSSMWTEYTSDYELYKPELILSDNVANDPDKAYLALDIHRRRSTLHPTSPLFGLRRSSGLSGPASPRLPQQQQQQQQEQQQNTPDRETSDDVFFKPSDKLINLYIFM